MIRHFQVYPEDDVYLSEQFQQAVLHWEVVHQDQELATILTVLFEQFARLEHGGLLKHSGESSIY